MKIFFLQIFNKISAVNDDLDEPHKGKLSEYKKSSFSAAPYRNFAVLTEILTSDQSVRSVKATQVAIKVLEAVYLEKTLML